MGYIRDHLSAKFFLANLITILVGVAILALTIQIATPAVFNRHLAGANQAMPGIGQGPGMGPGQGQGYGRTLFENFRASMIEALAYAVTASVLAALLVSLLLSRRMVAPLQNLMEASGRISHGQYEERVDVDGSDEIAQLAQRFNQMASELEQVENRRRQLIGDVTHELRTPLTSIKGYMEGLVDKVLPATPQTFTQIHAEADRLSRLVDDLQELSRVEAKAYTLDLHPVPVSNLVHTITKRLSQQAMSKQISLTSSIPADLPPMLADEDRITQVLINLVANAVQYTPEGGEIVVSAAQQAGEIQISVKDSGMGIPAEHIANLFTRFYRVDKSRSRSTGGGSGIGLTIAKHLVEAHGGRIWAESNGEGRGSTFHFTVRAAS